MRFSSLLVSFITSALAARPFLNEPDTGIDDALGDTPVGTLPPLENLVGLPDFEWAARRYMNTSAYTYYRNGAAGEWSYRNNLEAFSRFRLRPRVMVDITNVESTLPTTILGHNFSAPFFISPCAKAGYAHPEAEAGLAQGAAAGNILYMPSSFATLSIEEIAAAKPSNASSVTFQQVYLTSNDTVTRALFQRAEQAGSKAIVFTVDSAADGNRHRAARYGVGSADAGWDLITWDYYHKLQNMTTLPIIVKGIMTVEDAQAAVQNNVPAIILSNHGGRQLDFAPSSLEVALEIHQQDPDLFKQIEVYADGGVRQGTDILKLLALGVRAVGIGRPFMFANCYGAAGVERVIEMMKREVAIDAGNAGIADIQKITPNYVNWNFNNWYN